MVADGMASAVEATRVVQEEMEADLLAISALEVLQGTLKTAALEAMRTTSGPPVTVASVVAQLRLEISDMERHASMSKVAKKKLGEGEAAGGVTIVVGGDEKKKATKKR